MSATLPPDQALALRILRRHDGPMTARELADAMHAEVTRWRADRRRVADITMPITPGRAMLAGNALERAGRVTRDNDGYRFYV